MVYFFSAEIRSKEILEGYCIEGAIECRRIETCNQFEEVNDELKQKIINTVEEKYPDLVFTKDGISTLAFNPL